MRPDSQTSDNNRTQTSTHTAPTKLATTPAQPATTLATQTVILTPRATPNRTSKSSFAAQPAARASSLHPPPPPPHAAVPITTPRRFHSPFAPLSLAGSALAPTTSPPSPPPPGIAAQTGGRGGTECAGGEAGKGTEGSTVTNAAKDGKVTVTISDKNTKDSAARRSEFKPYTPYTPYTPGVSAQPCAKKDTHKLSPGKFSPPKIVAGLFLSPFLPVFHRALSSSRTRQILTNPNIKKNTTKRQYYVLCSSRPCVSLCRCLSLSTHVCVCVLQPRPAVCVSYDPASSHLPLPTPQHVRQSCRHRLP